MYKVLITGATGFLGTHLHRYLSNLGYECDTLSHDEFMHEDWTRLDSFQLSDVLTIYKGDGTKVSPTAPDIVIHCAWPRSTDLHSTTHLEFAEMSANFFNECKKRNIRVINIGSSSEYGPIVGARREDMACTPNTTYGIGKLAITLYAKKLGFNTLRLFTVTGEGGHNFKDVAKESKKWSDKYQVRDYVPVGTVCLAIQRLMHAEHLYGEIINIGRGYQVTNETVVLTDKLDDTVKIMSEQTRWDRYPQTQYEPISWFADTTKMRLLLNIDEKA